MTSIQFKCKILLQKKKLVGNECTKIDFKELRVKVQAVSLI